MALHIIPAGEQHQTSGKCPCRPRNERYRRRTAWRHRPNPVPTMPLKEFVYTVEFRDGSISRRDLAAVAARVGRC